jgi:hypothetical protein
MSILSKLEDGMLPSLSVIRELIPSLFYNIDNDGIKTIITCMKDIENLLNFIAKYVEEFDTAQKSFNYCPSDIPIDRVDMLLPILSALDERSYKLPFTNCDKDNRLLQAVERYYYHHYHDHCFFFITNFSLDSY